MIMFKQRHHKTPTEWSKELGARKSKRQRKATSKATVSASIGQNHDHPTDYQTRNSPNAAEWAQARTKEREQLEKYGVYTIVE